MRSRLLTHGNREAPERRAHLFQTTGRSGRSPGLLGSQGLTLGAQHPQAGYLALLPPPSFYPPSPATLGSTEAGQGYQLLSRPHSAADVWGHSFSGGQTPLPMGAVRGQQPVPSLPDHHAHPHCTGDPACVTIGLSAPRASCPLGEQTGERGGRQGQRASTVEQAPGARQRPQQRA